MCGNRFTQAHSLRHHLQKSCRAQKEALDSLQNENTVELYLVETEIEDEKFELRI